MPEITTSLRIPNYASAPASPLKGQLYLNTTDNLLYYYNGTTWIAESGGSGNVTNSGAPAAGQWAQWLTATSIKGLALASLQTTPTNATGITSVGTNLMLGFGAAASPSKITPTATGKLLVIIEGILQHSVAAGRCNTQMNYGLMGTAPVNGAALTGTQFGGYSASTSAAAAQLNSFMMVGVVTGLTVGSQYWIDVAMNLTGAGTGTALLVGVSAVELP